MLQHAQCTLSKAWCSRAPAVGHLRSNAFPAMHNNKAKRIMIIHSQKPSKEQQGEKIQVKLTC
jgi:hypothetical protein